MQSLVAFAFTLTSRVVALNCFGMNGLSYPDNKICPGTNACCNVIATCLPNKLCHNPGDPESRFVRGPCAVKGWDDSCAQMCLYSEKPAELQDIESTETNKHGPKSQMKQTLRIHPRATCSRVSIAVRTARTAALRTLNAASPAEEYSWTTTATSRPPVQSHPALVPHPSQRKSHHYQSHHHQACHP